MTKVEPKPSRRQSRERLAQLRVRTRPRQVQADLMPLRNVLTVAALTVLISTTVSSFAPMATRTAPPSRVATRIKMVSVSVDAATMQQVPQILQHSVSSASLQTRKAKQVTVTKESIATVTSTDDFLAFLDGAERDSLCVVKYHANFCKVCQRVNVKYRKLVSDYKKSNHPVRFADVEVTANQDLCRTLSIVKFPFVQIYRNGECVASFSTGPAHNFMKSCGGTLKTCLDRTKDEWTGFRKDFKKEIGESLEALTKLREMTSKLEGVTIPQNN